MNGDDVVTPRERLVEVLLEEALRGRPAVGASRLRTAGRLRWVAAAVVLLGVGVVVGTALLRSRAAGGVAPAQEPAQEPKPQVDPRRGSWHGPAIAVLNQADWDAVVPEVTGVMLRLLRTNRSGGLEEVDAGTGQVSGPEARALAALVPALGDAPFDAAAGEVFEFYVGFETNGRRVHGFVRLWDRPTLVLGSRRVTAVPEALQQRLLAMAAAAGKRLQVARGVVSSLDELAEVPADAKAIRCPPPPNGSLQRHLGRFTQLEHLEFVFTSFTTTLGAGQPISIQLPEVPTTLFDEMHVLPKLRHLRCNGALLNHDDRVRELLALPQLTSLRLDGMDAGVLGGTMGVRAGGVTVDGMRRLARRIEALELSGCEVPPELLEPWLEAAQLRRLVLSGNTVLPPELLARFVQLPTLSELGLGGRGWTDAHLAVLASSRITRLQLGPSAVAVAGLDDLPRSLQCIDLRGVDKASPSLQVLLRGLQQERSGVRVLRPGDDDPEDVDPFAGSGSAARR